MDSAIAQKPNQLEADFLKTIHHHNEIIARQAELIDKMKDMLTETGQVDRSL